MYSNRCLAPLPPKDATSIAFDRYNPDSFLNITFPYMEEIEGQSNWHLRQVDIYRLDTYISVNINMREKTCGVLLIFFLLQNVLSVYFESPFCSAFYPFVNSLL